MADRKPFFIWWLTVDDAFLSHNPCLCSSHSDHIYTLMSLAPNHHMLRWKFRLAYHMGYTNMLRRKSWNHVTTTQTSLDAHMWSHTCLVLFFLTFLWAECQRISINVNVPQSNLKLVCDIAHGWKSVIAKHQRKTTCMGYWDQIFILRWHKLISPQFVRQ